MVAVAIIFPKEVPKKGAAVGACIQHAALELQHKAEGQIVLLHFDVCVGGELGVAEMGDIILMDELLELVEGDGERREVDKAPFLYQAKAVASPLHVAAGNNLPMRGNHAGGKLHAKPNHIRHYACTALQQPQNPTSKLLHLFTHKKQRFYFTRAFDQDLGWIKGIEGLQGSHSMQAKGWRNQPCGMA